jgi:hypothetical protein
LCVFVPPQFFVCEKLLRSFLIANKKPSVTAGTLGEIPPNLVDKYLLIYYNVNMNKKDNIIFQNSLEIVNLVENECLLRILEGVAEYQKNTYYFDCIYSELENTWSEIYNLTILNKEIIELKLWNFKYYCEWHNQSSSVPFWEDYKNNRKKIHLKK